MTTSLAPHPLLIPPDLAKEIGLHEAVILQQIHHWLEKVIAQFCTSSVASSESVSDKQTNFNEDLCSAASDHSQNDFDSLFWSDNNERKFSLSTSIQYQEGNKLSPSKQSSTIDPLNKVTFASFIREELLTRLSALTNESVENLHHNTSLASALDRHSDKVDDALEFFQQASATWKNKPGIGLFIHAVKTGQKPSLTKPGCGWKEWADEATKRQLMEYSHSHDGDIMVHFVGGVSKLWSQLRGLSWAEVERASKGKNL